MISQKSPLIDNLTQASRRAQPEMERRVTKRIPLPEDLTLEMRRSDGHILCVTARNVSEDGVGFECRDHLSLWERIDLRLNGANGEFEPFEVVHMGREGDHLIIGAVLRDAGR